MPQLYLTIARKKFSPNCAPVSYVYDSRNAIDPLILTTSRPTSLATCWTWTRENGSIIRHRFCSSRLSYKDLRWDLMIGSPTSCVEYFFNVCNVTTRHADRKPANMRLRKFSAALTSTKIMLFNAFCSPIYGCQLWFNFIEEPFHRIHVAFNNALWLLLKWECQPGVVPVNWLCYMALLLLGCYLQTIVLVIVLAVFM